MKQIVALLFVVICGMSQAYADNLKIGVLDVHGLMQKAPQMKAITAKLEKQFKARQDRIVANGKALQEDMNKLKRDEAILTAAQKTVLQEKIVRNRRDLERLQQDFKQDAAMAQQEEMQKFFGTLKTVVDQFAESEHYDLIIQKQAVPYSSNSVDVTEKLIKKLERSATAA